VVELAVQSDSRLYLVELGVRKWAVSGLVGRNEVDTLELVVVWVGVVVTPL
jgi:hypothetical protein